MHKQIVRLKMSQISKMSKMSQLSLVLLITKSQTVSWLWAYTFSSIGLVKAFWEYEYLYFCRPALLALQVYSATPCSTLPIPKSARCTPSEFPPLIALIDAQDVDIVGNSDDGDGGNADEDNDV